MHVSFRQGQHFEGNYLDVAFGDDRKIFLSYVRSNVNAVEVFSDGRCGYRSVRMFMEANSAERIRVGRSFNPTLI